MTRKKTSLFVFLAALILLFAPIFSACQGKIKLSKPSFVNFQVNNTTGEQLLITDNNIYAREHGGFLFGISTFYNGADTKNFLTYKTDVPYLNVTEIFKNAQTYYYYSQAIGGGNYLTSDISEIKTTTIEYKLGTPTLEMSGTVISWTPIANANKYIVYCNDIVVTEVEQTSYDFSTYINMQNSVDPYVFKVACKQNNNYLKSAKSNAKTYTEHLILKTPTNLYVSGGTNKTLSWSLVPHCNLYQVVINGDQVVETPTNSLNVTSYITDAGAYTFKIKAVGQDNFKSSSFSSLYTYNYTKTLATPTDLAVQDMGTYFQLTWTAVEHADEYYLYLNGEQFVVNDSSGVNSPIVTNSVIVHYDDLSAYNLAELKLQVRAVASQGSFYKNSAISGQIRLQKTTTKFATPVISTVNQTSKTITIAAISGAEMLQIAYTFNGQVQTPIIINAVYGATVFDYSSVFCNYGTYVFKVKAVETIDYLSSDYSLETTIIIEKEPVQLSAPTVSSVVVDGNNLKVNFDKVDQNSQTFSLYANQTLLADNITTSNNKILLEDVFDAIGEQQSIEFYLVANQVDQYLLQSEKSNTYAMQTQLANVTGIAFDGSILSWSPVNNAQYYTIFVDNQQIDTLGGMTAIDLSNYVDQNQTRQIKIFAKTNHFAPSQTATSKIFNNVATQMAGYTDKYFSFGQTYDYYITSEQEMIDMFLYHFYNFITDFSVYVADYDSSTTLAQKTANLTDYIEGSWGASRSRTCVPNDTYGQVDMHIDYYTWSTYNGHTADYAQYQSVHQFKSVAGRSADYQFESDTYQLTQKVDSTDGLLWAVYNKATPVFVSANSVAEQVYNKAKQILRQICDDGMTDFEKALAIHDYVVMNVSYDHTSLSTALQDHQMRYSHFLEYAMLNNVGVCDAYAKMFMLLCNMEGIKTIMISGATNANDITGTGHAWNKIYLDANADGQKEWYAVDCTWDDGTSPLGTGTYEVLSRKYFLIPESYIDTRYEEKDYPDATTANGTYYSQFKFNNISVTVTSVQQFSSLATYLKLNGLLGMELLVKADIAESCTAAGVGKLTYAYDFDSNYKRVLLYV